MKQRLAKPVNGPWHVRFINTYEPVSTFYRDLVPYLARKGMAIELLISRNKYSEGRDGLAGSLDHPQIAIKYIHSPKISGKIRIRKMSTMVSYAAGCMWRTLFGGSVSLNFFLSQPPMFTVWGYFLKMFRGQPYCCLVMDVYPDVAMQNGLTRVSGIAGSVLTWVSRFALNHADRVIVIGRCMRDHLQESGVSRSDIPIIANWANEQVIFPVPNEKNLLRRELRLGDDFIVLYSGNMGVSHLFTDILEVARRLHGEKGLRFVFIGDGVRRKEILKAKDEHSLDNIILLPYQPVEKLSMSISLGDIHFVSLRNGFEGLVVPSKAYGALAAGRPIVYQGNEKGEIARMIIDEGIGAVVPIGNPDTLEEVILGYYNQPTLGKSQGEKAYELSRKRYSRERGVKRYAEIIESILAENGMLEKNVL
jgi:colanic acid biosynthesis glycosyl transferase WcaI